LDGRGGKKSKRRPTSRWTSPYKKKETNDLRGEGPDVSGRGVGEKKQFRREEESHRKFKTVAGIRQPEKRTWPKINGSKRDSKGKRRRKRGKRRELTKKKGITGWPN